MKNELEVILFYSPVNLIRFAVFILKQRPEKKNMLESEFLKFVRFMSYLCTTIYILFYLLGCDFQIHKKGLKSRNKRCKITEFVTDKHEEKHSTIIKLLHTKKR